MCNKTTWKQKYQCKDCNKEFIILNANGTEGCPFCKSSNTVRGSVAEPENQQFSKGELTKEAHEVIMYDLEMLTSRDHDNFDYHFQLLKDNLNDLFGMVREV